MPLHDKAFYAMIFFLGGVLLASFINDWQQKILIVILIFFLIACLLSLFGKYWLAILSAIILFGAGYYFIFDYYQKSAVNIPFGIGNSFSGLIEKVTHGPDSHGLVVALQPPYRGKIKVTSETVPEWHYGDLISLEGNIKKPDNQALRYYEKEGIFGSAGFPKIKLRKTGQSSPIKAYLFKFKNFSEAIFKKSLPPQSAAFMSGLTLGDTAGFTKEFKQQMSVTGTSHLVALSGYNISIIATSIMLVFGLWLSRRKTFIFTAIVIILFVVMTGAEASVVRAAIMGFLVLLADQVQRYYSVRNALVIAATAMVAANPKLLVWDVGFQLSFAAVLGLLYVRPVVAGILKFKEPGFLNWRDNLATTIAAQLAVLPILLGNFGLFSPLSIISNILILASVPLTMLLGFLMVILGIVSQYFAIIIGWLANLFLSYQIGVINFFSRFKIGFMVQNFSAALTLVYYAVLIGLVIFYNFKKFPKK